MLLSDVSVRRPVFAAVMSLLILLAGAIAYGQLSVREYPNVNPPIVSIETAYRGAAAAVIESRITQLIEDRLSGIDGIRSITSESVDGRSDITIEFQATRDVDEAANDVRDRVGGVLDDLPEEADPPEVRKVDNEQQPIMYFNLTGENMTRVELTDYANRYLVDRFSALDGVARVNVNGSGPSMRIWLNRASLAAYGLTPGDIEDALLRQNVELPAGRIESTAANLSARLARPFTTPEEFRQLVVSRGETGYLVRLGDVAEVEVGAENPYTAFRSNGAPGVGIGIVAQSGANTLEVARRAKALGADVARTLPAGMTFGVSLDESAFVEEAIESVWRTLAEAAVLVVLVIYIFLGSLRATIIPAVTVPLCLVATFAVLWLLGFSLNLLTLLALVLAIGLVVDDAIVVLENIYHRIEQGETPLVAAFRGAREVGFAVIAMTIVTCSVFVPVMFIAGNTGLLFRELAAAMIGAVAFSGFLALTLTPMLCSKLLKPDAGGNRFTHWIDQRFDRLSDAYARALQRLIRRPVLVSVAAVAVTGACILLGGTLREELAPQEDVGVFVVRLTAAEGTGFDQMRTYAEEIEQQLLPMVGDGKPMRRLNVRIPASFGASEDFSTAQFLVFLQPWGEREKRTDEIMREVVATANQHPAVRAFGFMPSGLTQGGQPIEFVIAGATYEELARARDAIIADAAENPALGELEADYKETQPQLIVRIDTVRAGDLGVSVNEIGRTLETMMGSRRVTTYTDRGEEYRVVLQARAADRLTPSDLTNVYVRSARTGELIALSNLVTLVALGNAGELGRYNKLRSITLEGSPAPGYSLGEALDWLEARAARQPEVAQVGYKGESLALRETGSSIYLILGLTILLVYLILAAQFESFMHPMVIILCVPMAVAGGLLGLAIMGASLNIYSQIGIVMLVGLASKNGILIVEFANQLRDQGADIAEAAVSAAGRRLRPVLMTSIATVAGAVPLMLASGAGAAARSAIGTVVVWGVSVATLLTLFVIPVIYNRFARGTSSPEAVTRKLEAEMEAGARAAPAE